MNVFNVDYIVVLLVCLCVGGRSSHLVPPPHRRESPSPQMELTISGVS